MIQYFSSIGSLSAGTGDGFLVPLLFLLIVTGVFQGEAGAEFSVQGIVGTLDGGGGGDRGDLAHALGSVGYSQQFFFLHIHGVDGIVNWIDALTREYMGTSWRVIGDRIIITDMDWIRAVDDVMNGLTVLSLSDDTLCKLLKLGGSVLNGQDNTEDCDKTDSNISSAKSAPTDDTKHNQSNVLDDWLK